jgi:hypothetical protein
MTLRPRGRDNLPLCIEAQPKFAIVGREVECHFFAQPRVIRSSPIFG